MTDDSKHRSQPSIDVLSRLTVRPALPDTLRSKAAPAMFATTATPDASVDTALLLADMERRPVSSDLSYRVTGALGKGGMAEVLRADQPAFCREVALKRLTLQGDVARAAFFSEARIMGKLDHANVVPVHAWVPDDGGTPMLAMKLVEGKSWREVLAPRVMPDPGLDEHVRTLVQVSRCIEMAHDSRILHRDLKPDNIMLGTYGQVYVMDWGIGVTTDRVLADQTGILHIDDAPGPAGTPAYMAPELAEGLPEQDERTDIYLLGAMLHEVVTNLPLHQGPDLATLRKRCLAGEREPFPTWAPDELRAIIEKATARERDGRYPNVKTFTTALLDYLAHREARTLIDHAEKTLERLAGAVTGARSSVADAAEHERVIHALLAELTFVTGRAKELWPQAAHSDELRSNAAELVLGHALAAEQLAVAERLVVDCPDPKRAARKVEALRIELTRREKELAKLRDANRRLDFRTIGRPLGTVFLVSGALGLSASFVSAYLLSRGVPSAMRTIALMWIGVALIPGVLARLLLKRHALPDSLASPRIFGLWAAVALGCTLQGAFGWGLQDDAFRDAHNQAAMLGIGFVAMGLQTRRWLLVPGALCFASALVIGFYPGAGVGLFGGMWFLVMSSVGIAFKLGATLGSDDRSPASRGSADM